MKRRTKAVLVAVAAVLQLTVVVLVGTGSAHAAVGPADDRQLSKPTNWATYNGATAAQVSSYLSANSARLTDIQVESSTPTFTVTMVKNSGSYASGWWWYYGKTEAQVNSLLSTNNARPISMSAYSTSSGVRYAVVMVSNSGANAKAWGWWHGSASFISGKLTTNHMRLIDFGAYPGGGYTAIMVNNTGSNATGWWWYYGISGSAVTSDLTTNRARLIDVNRNSNGTYNVVMYSSTTRAYWYYGYSPATMLNKANQLGERIIAVVSYTANGVKRQAAAMVENMNSLSQKLRSIIAPKVDSGAYGFYLKQVGGSTLASLQSTKQYEPASALKVLYHAKSIHEEALGNTNDSTTITYRYHNMSDPNDGDICPDDFGTTTTTNLKNADTLMMQNSDNRMTRGIVDTYGGFAAMETYATSLGLTSTAINHNIGCGTPHNKTTLVDLGKVYVGFQNGTVTSNSTWQAQFRSRMLNHDNYSGFRNSICPIVSQEATALGKSSATATSFCNAMTWIAKGGSYQYADNFPYTVSWDNLEMTGVPYKSGGLTTPKYFVFGEFVDGTNIGSQTEANSVNTARNKLYQEALRPYIHAALATW